MRALAFAVALAACAPSRATLFDPVVDAVRARTGITPRWRDGWQRSAAAERQVQAILAAPLTADGAATIAVLSNPRLQAAYSELAAVGGQVAIARAIPNPEIEARLRLSPDGPDQIELTAIESVSDLILAIPRARAADAELRAARRRAVEVTVAIASRARRAFYDAAAAEQRQRMRQLIAEAATASAELARGLHAAGNIPELQLLREELFEEEATLAVDEAGARAIAARSRLDAALGLHGSDARWQLASELPGPPETLAGAGDLERQTIAASLALEALRWEIEAAGRRIGAARLSSLLPDLGVGVSAERDGGAWASGPAVTLSLPLFDWGQGERAAAWARLRSRQHEYAAAAIEARAAARAAAARVQAAHARVIRIQTRVLPMREKLLDQAVRQYNAMNLDPFELLVIRREHTGAEEQYVDALREFWLAQTEVDALLDGSLPSQDVFEGDE